MVVVSLVFPPGAALATHEARTAYTLDVEPETATKVTGTTHTMTATLGDATGNPRQATGHAIYVDAEIETGPNARDGDSPFTPDLGCVISEGQSSCVLSYTGTGGTGTDQIRAWIDYDNNDTTLEADRNERRNERANPTVTNPNPNGTGCPSSPATSSSSVPPNLPGTPESEAQEEPDCTDVVEVTWVTGAEGVPATLDCDDSGSDADTEREANQSTTSPSTTSDEVYRCTVRSQSGSQLSGVEVKGEVENGINDPDEPDGDTKQRPDYTCVTQSASTTEAPFGGVAYCEIVVRQWEGEQGKADICFWVGTAEEGNVLCANEDVGEDQSPTAPYGSDGTGNDLADRVWKAWHQYELNCEPETATNPAGSPHQIRCTVQSLSRDSTGQPTRGGAGIQVDAEASGANDPQNDGDTASSRRTPDFTCTTVGDDRTTTENESGTCTITHGPGGTGSTNSTGVTFYRAWIDIDNNDSTDEADAAEGRDERTQPGSELEPDDTDVVEKRWGPAVAALTITPKSDSAPVGSCNAYTITTTTSNNQPAEGATIDVEQRHERAQNGTANDEPRVSFCTPEEGRNPSSVDESKGDLRPPEENPDNPGTAGGETTRGTDSQGQITIGIMVTPANGSDGTGRVDIVAWYETSDNDDPDSGEPQDRATKNWTAPQARTIDCEPENATNAIGTQHVVTCTVRNSSGQAVQGEGVTFTESGPGTISPTQANTDQNGQARTTATSNETGTQTITGTVTADTQGSEPNEVDECDRAANDPQGAPAGECSDSVTKNWGTSQARSIDCEPEAATNPTGTQHVVTCTVRNASGQPAAGEGVTFTETGPGTVSPTQATTNSSGQATTTATSTETGTQTITGTITADTQGSEPDEVDECDRAAGDPAGSQQGVCADSVEKTWVQGDQPECSDGIDNDNDGQTDHPADDGCESAADDDESDFPHQEFGGEQGQLVTEGACAGFTTGSVQNDPNGSGLVIVGTNGGDALQGSEAGDLICALDGDDAVQGNGGGDTIYGGDGKDAIEAGDGNDAVFGERDKDVILGDAGVDDLRGGQGNDNMSGGAGADELRGQGGWDTLKGNADNDLLVGAKGRDVLQGGSGADVARGGADDDVLKGFDGNDELRGGSGDDIIKGADGRDRLFGNAGDDFIDGGPGKDRCRGGRGRDILRSCP